MKNFENTSSRRKFMTMGVSSAAVLLGGAALTHRAQAGSAQNNNMLSNGTTITHSHVKAMTSDANLKIGDTVCTLGYHKVGDDGDNIYIIGSNTSTDDGGSIISLKNGLNAQGIFPGGIIRVEQFGAVGFTQANQAEASIDNSAAMTNAHKTGQVITYGAKQYRFNTLVIPFGGIIGRGDSTILVSTDTSTKDIVSYQGLVNHNEVSGIFKDFSLKVGSSNQKTAGAGIKFAYLKGSNNYTSHIQNVNIKNIPTSIHTNNASFYTIKDSYLSAYSRHGIFVDVVNKFTHERDSNIENNVLDSKLASAVAIKYHGGSIKVANNKISGGLIGIDLSPVNASPMAQITGNVIEKQKENSIRFTTQTKLTANENTDFTQLLISQNRLDASTTKGAAIFISPNSFTLGDLSINNNLIRFHGDAQAVAAIDINNSTRFMINNNTVNCHNGTGHRGIHISEDCSSGILSINHVILPLNGHTLNLSATTTSV